MSPGAGTAVRAPEQGGGAGALFIAFSHSCYPGPGSLIMSKLALSAGTEMLMVFMHVRVCVCTY